MTQELQNELGYGFRLYNPEAYIQAVINHFFSPVNKRRVDWQNVFHEGRVAMFEEDLRQGDNVPETTSNYWWRVAEAIGTLLWEDYNIGSIFARRRKAVHLYQVSEDPETAAIYYEKQRTEPDPATEVETKEWIDHYLGLAEGVILDNEDVEQGQRDWLIFELWVNGFSTKEINDNPEVTWLKDDRSVDKSLRRILHRLWKFFGVNPEEHAMVIGYAGDKSRTSTGKSQKENFTNWYANPVNRERHRQKDRERKREKRAEAKKAKAQ